MPALAAALASCGGGGGGGTALPPAAAPTPTAPAASSTPSLKPTPSSAPSASPPPAPSPSPSPSASPRPTSTPTASPRPTSSPTAAPGGGAPLAGPTLGPNGGWGPTAVANALQFPVQSGFNGAGQTVAIVIDSGFAQTDLSTYLAYFQIPSTGRTISTEQVDGSPGTADQAEATLDVETVAALAPGANVIVYEVPDLSDQDITDAYDQIIGDGKASVVSSSFGGCEYANPPESPVLQQGALQHVLFVASSGDQGNECFSSEDGSTPVYAVGVSYPASDPNGIGVGGTETYGRPLTSATVWNDSKCSSGQCAAGGGVSAHFGLPSFQQGLAGASSAQWRNVPDVSMPAELTSVYEAGSWGLMSGTSWSAPQFAALMAEVYHYCESALASPASVPYYVTAHSASAFIDVTSGNDQFDGTSPFYSAGPGYDDASGIGVPLGMPFADTICPGRVPAAALRASPAAIARAQYGTAQTRTLDVTPRVAGLADRGRRSILAQTRVQLVLRPAAGLAGDEQTALAILRQANFTIVRTFPNHLVIDAEAPSGTVERFFETQLHDVSQGAYGTRYLPAGGVTIPASLTPYAASVSLDDVVTRHAPR